jgi:hypothetical protein
MLHRSGNNRLNAPSIRLLLSQAARLTPAYRARRKIPEDSVVKVEDVV